MHASLVKIFTSWKKIAFVGWWTGWHIEPILAIYKAFPDLIKTSLWIGGNESNEELKAKENGISFSPIQTLKLTTTRSPKVLLYPFILLWWVIQAYQLMKKSRVELVFSKWWPGSVSVGIAAWILWLPLSIHESDTIPGRSNRILGELAQTVFLGFESAMKYFSEKKCTVIWQILDPIFTSDSTHIHSSIWKTKKKHIFVLCGSQGSRSIFQEIIQNCKDLDAEWILSLGNLNTGMREQFHDFSNIQLFDWIKKVDIVNILSDTDICITRWSATTLAEIDIFHVPKIIVPLPDSAGNHQYHNAIEYEKRWDILLEQKNLKQLLSIITNQCQKR